MRKQIILAMALIAVLVLAGGFYGGKAARSGKSVPVPSDDQGPSQESSSAAGMIAGYAINSEGQRIAGARIFAEREDALHSLAMSGYTDANGEFKLNLREPGYYSVYGSKEADGYLLTISSFHQVTTIPTPKVSVAEKQVVRDVIVQLGPKLPSIRGQIIDTTTNHFITKASITLRRVDNPQMYYIVGADEVKENGRFSILVPPVPFTIEVSAPNYETWTYRAGLNHHAAPLQVNNGETKILTIGMKEIQNLKNDE
jgi:Carboxypeptidase regulatory-like domain